MQKYTCADCNNKIKSNIVIVGPSEGGSDWICEDCLQKRKDEIPKILPKVEVNKNNSQDNNIERIEKKFVKGIECNVYHYKEGVLTYCNNCNHNAHKMVEFQKGVEKYWMCSKCFHDYISGNVSNRRTMVQTENPEYKKLEEQSLLGINYTICTYVKGKSFYCDYCGHNRKRVVEVPVISGHPKMCFHCFSSKTKIFRTN